MGIGSLYQYFHDRDDVLKSVLVERVRREADDVIELIQSNRADDPVVVAVDYLLDTYGPRREMLRRLMPHLPRVHAHESVLQERARVAEAIASILDGPEATTRAEVLVAAVMGVFQTWILDADWDAQPDALRPVLLAMIRGVTAK